METVTSGASTIFLTVTGVTILLLIGCSGVFSGSETALTTANRAKLHVQAEKGDAKAIRALKLIDDKERLIGGILLGNNLVNILATSLATMLFAALLGDAGVAVATLVMTTLVLIFAEVLPKTYAISNAEKMSKRVSGVIGFAIQIFAPIVIAVQFLVQAILRLFGVRADASAHMFAAHDEIAGAVALHHLEGAVEKADHDRILGVLDLAQRTVEEVMTHRSDIEMIDIDMPIRDIIRKALSSPYTRLPIYKGNTDEILGVLHMKDLSREIQRVAIDDASDGIDGIDIKELVMQPYFIPEMTRLDTQLMEFLKQKTHIAVVIDEYGSLQGLVTLEDIVEEIIGEVVDEHDIEEDVQISVKDDGSIHIDGDMTIRDLNRHSDFNLEDSNSVTVAGYVINEIYRIPETGEEIELGNLKFTILERDMNRITRIGVTRL